MHNVKLAKDMKISLCYDDRILDSGVIARMLAERRRRQDESKAGKRTSLLSAFRRMIS
jgi:hypothetical protein